MRRTNCPPGPGSQERVPSRKSPRSTRPVFYRSVRFWIITLFALAALAALYGRIDLDVLRAKAEHMNGLLAFCLLTFLPLVGFPASALHVVVGVRFGVPLGLALVWLSILLQLLLSYGLVHWRRRFFEKRFKALRDRIPPGAHVPVTIFAMLIPGAPFFTQLYTPPLLGVPLRVYLAICLPIHSARSIIAVVFGGESHQITLGWVAGMLAYGAVLLSVSWWAYRRTRGALGDQPPVGSGRKQPA